MKHVMIDIETMSRRPNAAIVALAAVPFTLTGEVAAPVSCFYHAITLKSCQEAGLHIGAETVEWWMKQNSEARYSLFLGREPLDMVLDRFTLFLQDIKTRESCEPFLWSSSPGFDNVILREAYVTMGKPCPWDFRKDRCMRTLEMIYHYFGHSLPKRILAIRETGFEHHALHDAIYQAAQASEMLNAIGIREE